MAHKNRKKYYTRDELWQTDTKVRAKAGSPIDGWREYVGTVVGFRWRDDGGIDYRVRAWRQNLHWWPAEHLELVREHELCANCKAVLDRPTCNCNCGCGHGC